jgi:phage terminase large subunit-like protein
MAAVSSLCYVGRSQRLVSERARQLAVLQAEWQRSTLGELRVTLVLGDRGWEKTRLAAELVPHSAELPVGLLAHCGSVPQHAAVRPWADTFGLRARGPHLSTIRSSQGGHNGG